MGTEMHRAVATVVGEVPITYAEHFRVRVLQDALAKALPAYWRRRADAFAAVGSAECDEVAVACRLHAALIEQNPVDFRDLIAAELAQVA